MLVGCTKSWEKGMPIQHRSSKETESPRDKGQWNNRTRDKGEGTINFCLSAYQLNVYVLKIFSTFVVFFEIWDIKYFLLTKKKDYNKRIQLRTLQLQKNSRLSKMLVNSFLQVRLLNIIGPVCLLVSQYLMVLSSFHW